jgi:hypothetical protein
MGEVIEMPASFLDDENARAQILQAWRESNPGTDKAHEEGGFVLRDADGALSVERWPRGAQNDIIVPAHPRGKRHNRLIIATFHTHPNPGAEFRQEPSLTDIRAVCGDPDLGHPEYEGEIVIATEYTYQVRRNGDVEVLGTTEAILKTSSG